MLVSRFELKASAYIASEHIMTIRKTVTLIEEINSEYGARATPPSSPALRLRSPHPPLWPRCSRIARLDEKVVNL